ncbi:GlxA family transcriptional regulator [Kushneria phosphatilytica]|nr:GlxA family transcriptional regulator [Kushneria phosphatilytica]
MATVGDTMPGENNGHRPMTVGFLLLNDFTLISLASAVEPLRMANQLAGKELYCWYTLTHDGESVRASDGLSITPDGKASEISGLDMVVVCGGVGIQNSVTRAHINWLCSQASPTRRLGAICTGSWALAAAGLLDGYEASAHWECLAAMQEAFPRTMLSTRLYSIDRDRFTCTGGTAPMDMMLNLISRDHGRELSAGISEMFMCERMRSEQDQQRVPLRHVIGARQPRLLEIVALMEANLEEPIALDELASYVNVSRRQLERLFQRHLGCSPSRYYLRLRLARARSLLRQSAMSVIDVAAACGFVSTPHFSKCYRESFGTSPRDDRGETVRMQRLEPLPRAMKPSGERLTPVSAAALALDHARGEPTYASLAF